MDDNKALAEKAGPVARLHGRETLIAHLPCESWPFGPSVWETEVQIEDRRGLASEIIGPPVDPHDVPDMSVLEIAYRIARKGGAVDFEVSDETIWNSAVVAVLDKVRSGETEVSGHSSEGKCADPVPAYKFRGKIRIEHPYQRTRDPNESAFNDEPTLHLGGYGGDKLCEENHRTVSRDLRISGREVARLWPFDKVRTAHRGSSKRAALDGRAMSTDAAVTGNPSSLNPKAAGARRGGPNPKYDGELLKEEVIAHVKAKTPFPYYEILLDWCLEHGRIKLRVGKKAPTNRQGKPSEGPDRGTVDAIIKKYDIHLIPGVIASPARAKS
jgi:hypothetical protein